MRLLAFLQWPFGIREDTRKVTRLGLAIGFVAVVGVLWIYATDNPYHLNQLIIRLRPEYQLAAGDPVDLTIDRAKGQLHVTKRATGRTIVRDLPAIAAEAMPALGEDTFGPLFAKLAGDGLGRFARQPDGTVRSEVVDAEVAAERLRGVGPYPRERPLVRGEPVEIVIDFQGKRARLLVDRVGRTFEGMLGKVPAAEERFPPSLDQYAYLPKIAERAGVGGLSVHPAATADEASHQTARLFRGIVEDVAKAREVLGPQSPVAPLAQGEVVMVALAASEGRIELRRAPPPVQPGEEPRPGKTHFLDIETRMLSPTAIPVLGRAAYPRLEALLASDGVAVSGADGALVAEVGSVDVARKAGLGLEKPAELRRLTRNALPSPTEVWQSRRVLIEERKLFEALQLTVGRVLYGFGMAVLVTLPLGLIMGAFGRLGSLFEPLRLGGMYLPLPALIPLTIAWQGLGEKQVTLFLAISSGVVLLPYVVQSIQDIPQVYLDTARTLGASRGQQFRFVMLAISWSTLFKGLRTSFAVGWTWMMLAEMNGVSNGLGYIINTSQRRGLIEHVYIVMVLVIALAVLANLIWTVIIWLLFPNER